MPTKILRHFVLFAMTLVPLIFPALAHGQMPVELTCPSGSSPMPDVGTTFNLLTGKSRQWLCYDSSGNVTATLSGGVSSAFSALTSGTNTTASMFVGTGASLAPSGTGTVQGSSLLPAVTQGTDPKYVTDAGGGVPGATMCRDALGGISTTGCTAPLVSGIVTAGLLAEYRFNEGTGTTLTDYSGNGNNGTFCASGPNWTANNPTNGGLNFNGTSNCINLPSALNSARTIILVTSFAPGNTKLYQAPVCGNIPAFNNVGGVFRGAQLDPGNQSGTGGGNPPIAGPNGGEYFLASGGNRMLTIASASGTQIVGWLFGSAGDSTNDQIWVNNNQFPFAPIEPALSANPSFVSTGQSAGLQSSGNYVLGGAASNACFSSVSSWFTGHIYYALFYSTFLTPAQLGQDYVVIASSLAQREIQLGSWNPGSAFQGTVTFSQSNQYIAVGDSITFGTGLNTTYPTYIALPTATNPWNWVDIGLPSIGAIGYSDENHAQLPQSWIYPNGASNAMTVWLGTNDCNGVNTAASGQNAWSNVNYFLRQMRLHGTLPQTTKLIIGSMISRTGEDVCKNALNTLMRANWSGIADGLADLGADTVIGADGTFSNTTVFQGDAIHPTTHGQANNIAPIMQRAIRRAFGNLNWSTANTYTTTTPAATALTATSEATNTMTFTMAANPFGVGKQVTVTGVTPAGYNGTWNVLTSTGTTFTAWNNTTALGAGTVFGSASTPVQVDEDVYVILGGSATTPNFTLETCVGYTGQNIYLKNSNTTSPWTVTPFGSETIDGAASLTMPTATSGNNPVVILQSTLVSATAAGCTWKRLQ